jgi:hypothetical protein
MNSQQAAEEAFSEPQFPTLPETSAPTPAPADAGPSLPLDSAAPSLPAETESVAAKPESEGIRLHAPIKLDGPAIAPSPAGDEGEADAPIAATPRAIRKNLNSPARRSPILRPRTPGR